MAERGGPRVTAADWRQEIDLITNQLPCNRCMMLE
jgi:hypothetical protein